MYSLEWEKRCLAGMMLCNEDLTDKHLRVFKMDCDEGTIEWAKDVGLTRGRLMLPTKGPFSLIAAKEVSGGILELTTTAQPLWIKPAPGAEYKAWLECCNSVVAGHRSTELKQMASVAVASSGVVNALTRGQTFGTLGPCPMMFCKPSLKDKHVRWIMLNCDLCSLEWSKKEWVGLKEPSDGKGPFLLLAVKEVQRAVASTGGADCILELKTPTETAYIKPESDEEYQEWLACCRLAISNMRK